MEINDVLTFSYNGSIQTQNLEAGKYKLECWGAQGGGIVGGKGGYVTGEYILTEPKIINIYVGGQSPEQTGGWNGGGNGHGGFGQTGGGGASDIRVDGIDFINRIIVGAGGGGRGSRDTRSSGHGGGLIGTSANEDGATPGSGGTQSIGGSLEGAFGKGGNSTNNTGGGGGGYYGGGSGISSYAGGGGGSSYYGSLENPSTTAGLRIGNGEIKITMLEKGGSGPMPTSVKRRFAQII